MEESYGIILLGLAEGQPKILNIKEILQYYISHRQEVIKRRTQYNLRVAQDRLHIVEGLRIAIDNLDEIVDIIRNSKDRETARGRLTIRFGLTEIQANAILDMRLAQLTGLERNKLEEEYNALLAKIADYKDILATPERVLSMIKEDLIEIKDKYGDKRRTEIVLEANEFNEEDFIDDHDVLITLSNRGYIKRQLLDTYKAQKRGGRGISSTSIRSEEAIMNVLVTSVLSNILFFTNQGRAFTCKGYQIPESSRQAKGIPVINFVELRPEEYITTMVAASEFNQKQYLLMLTKQGIIKKVPLAAFKNIRKNGLIAVNLHEGDELVGVVKIKEKDKVIIATSAGLSIMFEESQVRAMGRNAAGVKAINLGKDDFVVGIDKYRQNAEALLVTEHGYGKRTKLSEFKEQKRGGKGLKAIEITNKNGNLVAFKIVTPGEELVILTGEGHVIRLQVEDISIQKRYSRGVLLMRLPVKDNIVGVARFKVDKDE